MGTQTKDCDRALIISGGVDDNNNHARYKDNVILKYKKLKELGFTDEQIGVFYNDGSAIDVDGTNIVDDKTSKQKTEDILGKFRDEMEPSCTLTIFVTDHGTGYNAEQGYHGARPALDPARESGITYPENTFKFDLRSKVYRATTSWTTNGKQFFAAKDETGKWFLYKKEGGDWVYKGGDANGDGWITEGEIGEDLNGDGDSNDGVGWKLASIETDLGEQQHQNNEWDTDGDGAIDVRARWDGTRYVIERLDGGEWKEMGRDANGNFVVDGADGGVDWNLDGDKNDRISFHEGINLWGNEVLWDDELANMLKPLHEKGIHILVEMVSCFSGGFVGNLQGLVEKIVTGSSEDTKHWNRVDAAGKVYAADQKAFIENLAGIDIESWNKAWDEAIQADRQEWQDEGSNPVSENKPQKWEKPLIASESTFYEQNGFYGLILSLPESLEGKVFDMEIFFGLQKPRWESGEATELPAGFATAEIPGGIRITSSEPFPLTSLFKFRGEADAESLRIHLTDGEHRNLGYVMPQKVVPPVFTRSPEIADCATLVGLNTGQDDCLAEIHPLVDESDYLEFMLYRINMLLDPSAPPISEEKRDCVWRLLEYLEFASSSDRQWAAEIFMDSYFQAQETTCPVEIETLKVSFAASAHSISDLTGCQSTVTISVQGLDLTEGTYPVSRVVLTVNDAIWLDSGDIAIISYDNAVSQEVGCGQTLAIEVTAVNSVGHTVTTAGSFTTPVP